MYVNRSIRLAVEAAVAPDGGAAVAADPTPIVAQTVRVEPTGEAKLLAVLKSRRQAKRTDSAGTTPKANAQSPATAPVDPAATADPGDVSGTSPEGDSKSASALDASALEGAQSDPEPEDNAPPADETEDPNQQPKAIRSLIKRIDKLTARLKGVEAENQKLKAAGTTAKPAATATPGDAAGGDPRVSDLDSRIATLNQWLEWADANEGGGTTEINVNGKLETREFTPEQVRQMRRNFELNLVRLTSERTTLAARIEEDLNAKRQQMDQAFAKRFTWAADETTDEAQLLSQFEENITRQFPQASKMPGFRTFAAYAVEGMMAEQRRQQAPAKPQAPRQQPPRVAVPQPRGQIQQSTAASELARAEADFRRAPTEENHQRLLSLRRQARVR